MKGFDMKKTLSLFFLFVILILNAAASYADSPIVVDHRMYYMCGDIYELSFPDVPGTSSMVSNTTQVHATAGQDERLLQIRVQMRNMTHSAIQGLNKDCFTLKGYVRDRSITYKPEVITFTDYFGSGNYYNWDNLPPMRMADILLIFRVKPVLVNWELSIDTSSAVFTNFALDNVSYIPDENPGELCFGTFQFTSQQTLETGMITIFRR